MQMHAMNQFGNRGFGGPPQPQRQGGRRGNNRGGFRNSRFEPTDQNNQQQQRNQNQPQGGQRPNEPPKPAPTPEKATPPPIQQQNTPQNKPPQPQQQQNKPQQQQNKPQQQQNKPQQQQQPQPPKPQQQQQPPAQQLKPENPPQVQQAKPVQNAPPKPIVDNVDLTVNDPTPLMQTGNINTTQQPPQQKNVNGNFQGNKQGGWSQGGPANKQGGSFNKQGGNFNNQGNQNQEGGRPFNNQEAGRPFNNQEGGRPFNNQEGGRPFNNQEGGRPFNNQEGGRPFNNQEGGRPPFNNQGGGFNNQGNKQFGQKHGGGPGGGPGGMPRNQRGGRGGPGGPKDGMPAREEQMLANKLKDLMGPLVDIPTVDQTEVKFNGRSRLYIGNLTSDASEEEIQTLFSQFGECAELFINKEKNFGFIKMDFRVNAEKAKRELDGKMRNGRSLRVRFAPHNCAVRVKNLPPFVSNELLYRAFEIFGRIERAYVRVDERGKPLGEGIVEFSRKPSALAALRNCTEKCFFLTSSLRPVIVESFEEPDELDGYPEKNLPKKHPEYMKAREVGPRFSEPNSFEHEYGTRWKQLHELHRQKEEALKKELASEEEKLEAQMEYAKYEHETELLREQLRQREQDRERQKRSWEMAERAAETRRDTERAQLLRQEEELSQRMRTQDDELRRRQQENTLFVQAQRLSSMLDRQEQGMFDQQSPMDGGFREQFEQRGSYEDMSQGRGWEGPRPTDDYPNKRRRY